MRLLFTVVLLGASVWAQSTQPLALAIAKAEGFGIKGTIPTRCHNAGDLKGHGYIGQLGVCKGGHAIFRTDADGWSALNRQLEKIISGESTKYSVNMSLREMGKKYAGNWRLWSKNVAHNLGVTPDTTLAELFDLPPVVFIPAAPLELD